MTNARERATVWVLLVTSRWPMTAGTEFLDDEMRFLADTFESVVVAPMRPDGPPQQALPANVHVDASLAEYLERSSLSCGRSARKLTAVERVLLPNSAGLGFTREEAATDWKNPTWIRHSLLNRADSTSVANWALPLPAPDIAYTFWLGASVVGLRRAWPNTVIVSRAHGGDLFAYAHGWSSIPFQRAAITAADLVASVSHVGQRYLADRFPGMSEKISLQRIGIPDVGQAQIPPQDGDLRLLSVSSIDANKRVLMMAQLAKSLAAGGRSVTWTHLGDGPQRPEVEEELAQRPDSLTVRLRGQVPISEVRKELTSGRNSAFVNLSLSEGAPVSLMEAQCAGLPVVATGVGGTPEVVPRHLNELVDPTAQLSEVTRAVLRAAARPPSEFSERRSHWAENYSVDVNYPRWTDQLLRLAKRGRVL